MYAAAWVQLAKTPLDEALACFAGQPGGPHVHTWQLRPPAAAGTDHTPRVKSSRSPFPQPLSAGGALAIVQVQLLGRLFAVTDEETQSHVLSTVIAALAAEAPPTKGARRSGWEESLPLRVPSVCAFALMALSAVAKAFKAAEITSERLSAQSHELGMALLAFGGAAVRPGAPEPFDLVFCASRSANVALPCWSVVPVWLSVICQVEQIALHEIGCCKGRSKEELPFVCLA
jgi:hypothetical protein